MTSRWMDSGRIDFGNLPTEIPLDINQNQLKIYISQVRLEEINRKLRSGEVIPTRILLKDPQNKDELKEYWQRRLERERAKLIEEVLCEHSDLQTDLDYETYLQRNVLNASKLKSTAAGGGSKPFEKVWIPQNEYPEINFIGLLIGPRGNTLRKMEAETGAKISIRGKGSHKEGKMDPASLAAADEPLHAHVSGDSQEIVDRGVKMINRIIETAASAPEEANELKKLQLRELAALNGTYPDADAIVCSNCGQNGHRRFECTQQRNITNSLLCRICGGAGHMTSDCLHKDMLERFKQRMEQIDCDLQHFLADVSGTGNAQRPSSGAAAAPWAAQWSQ